jgi:site-specific DNA-methyltransferase (adenine-specific)
MDVAQAIRNDLVLQNNITWVKNISIHENSYGHFKPIKSKRFLNVTNEAILHFTKKGMYCSVLQLVFHLYINVT